MVVEYIILDSYHTSGAIITHSLNQAANGATDCACQHIDPGPQRQHGAQVPNGFMIICIYSTPSLIPSNVISISVTRAEDLEPFRQIQPCRCLQVRG